MTYRAIYTVLKTLGLDPLLAFDLAFRKYGEHPDCGYTGKLKWDRIVKDELPKYILLLKENK